MWQYCVGYHSDQYCTPDSEAVGTVQLLLFVVMLYTL